MSIPRQLTSVSRLHTITRCIIKYYIITVRVENEYDSLSDIGRKGRGGVEKTNKKKEKERRFKKNVKQFQRPNSFDFCQVFTFRPAYDRRTVTQSSA